MKKILVVFGTRPEAIKLAPVIKALIGSKNFQCKVCVTGQHREMLDEVLNLFEIVPCFDLDLMKEKQSLNELSARILVDIKKIYQKFKPDIVLVHGDTSTSFIASLAAYYEKIPVGHVEAGLRTNDIYSPWPEEINRRLIASIADIHFAPTIQAKANLVAENVPAKKISVTGNTVIDALNTMIEKIADDPCSFENLKGQLNSIDFDKKIVLVTTHRRENFGSGLRQICEAIARLANHSDEIEIVVPVHPNPNVKYQIQSILSNQPNIHLVAPLEYLLFVFLMNNAAVILTDSGGIQEEAISLRKPVLVMRDTTERNEAIETGLVKLVGTDCQLIFDSARAILDETDKQISNINVSNPYGNGDAAQKIIKSLEVYFEV